MDAQWRTSKLKYYLYRRALQQVFDHYESHPEEALNIIRQAQAYTQQFLDAASERLLTQHVCQAYFDAVLPLAKP